MLITSNIVILANCIYSVNKATCPSKVVSGIHVVKIVSGEAFITPLTPQPQQLNSNWHESRQTTLRPVILLKAKLNRKSCV